ncbi:SSI family serine proteinase inhibitor [Streptomyces sp. NPDC057757]|uniref:SSI family serine proteinase inhibitor n=1 Tax=Streptomyces sp. NPDC057757 TaxID=3346241 RepID=UPI00368A4032
MLRRLVLTLAASAAALSAVPAAVPAAALPTATTASAASAAALSTPSALPAPAPPAGTTAPAGFTGSLGSPGSLSSLGPTGSAGPVPFVTKARTPPPARDEDSRDRLTVTVHDAGNGADGTYELRCHPGGGSHPDVSGACAALDRGAQWGKDPFAPVPPDALCTMQYGGPATAHVTGTWAGRPVDARFDRGDGCQISRWNALTPLLPTTRS